MVSNAVRHGQDTAIVVSVWNDGTKARVNVEDSGPGVPAHVREKIFRRGWRANPTGERHGLGLWIAREAAHELYEDLVLETQPGPGAKLVLSLPLG